MRFKQLDLENLSILLCPFSKFSQKPHYWPHWLLNTVLLHFWLYPHSGDMLHHVFKCPWNLLCSIFPIIAWLEDQKCQHELYNCNVPYSKETVMNWIWGFNVRASFMQNPTKPTISESCICMNICLRWDGEIQICPLRFWQILTCRIWNNMEVVRCSNCSVIWIFSIHIFTQAWEVTECMERCYIMRIQKRSLYSIIVIEKKKTLIRLLMHLVNNRDYLQDFNFKMHKGCNS